MRATETLKKRFEARLSRVAISSAIEINDTGLIFGAGTVLARMRRDESGAGHLDIDKCRIFALLAAAYGRTVSPDVFRHIEGASEQWRRGDKALANMCASGLNTSSHRLSLLICRRGDVDDIWHDTGAGLLRLGVLGTAARDAG